MKPTQVWKNKGLQVAMWQTNNGGYSFSINKRYKDKKTEEWKDSKYFWKDDLTMLIELLKQAVTYDANKTAHEEARGPIRQPAQPKYELTQEEIDDIPF